MPKLSADQQAVIDGIAQDRLSLADRLNPILFIDGVPYEGPDTRDLVASGSDGRTVEATDSEPGVQLSALVATRLDTALDGREVRMDFDVGGSVLPGYAGYLGYPRHVGSSTEIEAYTSAFEWPDTPIRQDTEYINARADGVAFSALSVLSNRYRSIELPPGVSEPRVTLQGSDKLKRSDKISDIIDLLEGDDEARVRRFVDTSLNVATAYSLTPLTQAAQTVWEIREGEDCRYGEVTVEPVFEKPYFAVEVHQSDEAGNTYVLAERKIDNGGKNVPPSRVLVIEYENDSDSTSTDREKAHQIAFNEAMRRGKDAVRVTAPVCYWPMWIERGDVVGATTEEFTGQTPESAGMRGSIVRRYVFRVDGFVWGPQRNEGQLAGEGLKISEVFVPARERAPRRELPVRQLFGRNYAGRPFLSTDLPWVTYVPERNALILNTEVAEEYNVDITQITGPKVRIRG